MLPLDTRPSLPKSMLVKALQLQLDRSVEYFTHNLIILHGHPHEHRHVHTLFVKKHIHDPFNTQIHTPTHKEEHFESSEEGP